MLRRILRVTARVVLVIFEIAITLISLLPLAREPIRKQVNAALANSFQGTLTIDAIDHLDFHGVRGGRVTISDAEGTIITADGVDGDASVLDIAIALLRSEPLVIDRARIARADVSLAQSADGSVRIAKAFLPRTPTPGSGPSTFRLRIDRIEMGSAWVHGRFGSQYVDADAEALHATLAVGPGNKVRIDGDLGVRGRAIPRDSNPVGHAHAALVNDDAFHLRAVFDGNVGTLAAQAGGGMDGDRAFASVIVDRSRFEPLPEAVSAQARAFGSFAQSRWDLDAKAAMGAKVAVASARWESGMLHAHARAAGEGNSAEVDFDMRGGIIDANGGVHVADLASIAGHFESAKWKGHGELEVSGQLDLDAAKIDAHGMLAMAGVARNDIRAGTLDADANVKGALADPAIDLRARLAGLAIPNTHVSAVTVSAKGRGRSADVTARIFAVEPIDVHAHGGLIDGGAGFDRIVVDAKERLALGSFRWQSGAGEATVVVPPVEIARVRALVGSDVPMTGRVAVAGKVRFTSSSLEGFASVDLSSVEWNAIHALGGHADITATGNRWSVVTRAHTSAGWLSVETVDLAPAGSPFARSSWENARGTVHVATTVDLATLPLPASVRAVGTAHVTIDATRTDPAQPPTIEVAAETHELHAFVHDTEVDGDLSLVADVDAAGNARADLDARSKGVRLASMHVVAPIAWAEIVRGRIPSWEGWAATPIVELDAIVPWGDAERFCKLVGRSCKGQLGLVVAGSGMLGAPHAKLAAVFGGFRTESAPVQGAMNGSVDGSWDGRIAKVTVDATAGKTGTLFAKATLDAADPTHWFASIESTMNDFPLRTPGDVSPKVKAHVTGTFALDNLHKDARVRSDLVLTKLEVDDTTTDTVRVKAGYDGAKLGVDASFDGTDGTASIHVASAATWGAELAPKLDTSTIELELLAKGFRLKTLSGLIPGNVGDFDGRLDADADASISVATSKMTAHGWAKVRSGSFGSAMFGELNDITADVAMHDDGVLRLDEFRARSGAGWLHASGWARIPNGILEEAKLEADIGKSHPFPLTVGGAHIGDVWGRVEASGKPSNGKMNARLDVPIFHVILPSASAHDLEDLEPSSKVRIGVRKNGELVTLPLTAPVKGERARSGTPITIDIQLGQDVQVEQGDTLRATLTGRPRVEIDHGVRVFGQVVVTQGTMDVSGKRFQIERATATFTGDPGNPMIFATAAWDAPDGSKIHADYSGTVAKGKVTLRSEPAHTHDEIIALLIFGTTSGPSGGGRATDTTATAAGTGASLATQPLNKALRELTTLDIRTRVDTSEANPKTEVEVQIARDIAASIAYVIGVPPPGTNPDKYWLTVAWRVSSRWTADATVGDYGSSIFELTWHYRY